MALSSDGLDGSSVPFVQLRSSAEGSPFDIVVNLLSEADRESLRGEGQLLDLSTTVLSGHIYRLMKRKVIAGRSSDG